MLVVFDGRAQSVPAWLAASGFTLWEGVKLAGAQYRIPYLYKASGWWCGLVGGGAACARGAPALGNGPCQVDPCGSDPLRADPIGRTNGQVRSSTRAFSPPLWGLAVVGARPLCFLLGSRAIARSPYIDRVTLLSLFLLFLFLLAVVSPKKRCTARHARRGWCGSGATVRGAARGPSAATSSSCTSPTTAAAAAAG